jgi:hypothetical protein
MLVRLGRVLYWTGATIAILALTGSVLLSLGAVNNGAAGNAWPLMIVGGSVAAISWLVGRALRYILAAE